MDDDQQLILFVDKVRYELLKNIPKKTWDKILDFIITMLKVEVTVIKSGQEFEAEESADDNPLMKELVDIKSMLEPMKKLLTGTLEEKGTYGERVVMSTIASCGVFSEGELIDSSGFGGLGDGILKWKDLYCLIEVKNKIYLTHEDIEKFRQDLLRDKFNCGLFVSLRTKILSGKMLIGDGNHGLSVEFLEGKPVIYLYFSGSESLISSILMLQGVAKMIKKLGIVESGAKKTNLAVKKLKESRDDLEKFNRGMMRKINEVKRRIDDLNKIIEMLEETEGGISEDGDDVQVVGKANEKANEKANDVRIDKSSPPSKINIDE
jgi:hypothetical protein